MKPDFPHIDALVKNGYRLGQHIAHDTDKTRYVIQPVYDQQGGLYDWIYWSEFDLERTE